MYWTNKSYSYNHCVWISICSVCDFSMSPWIHWHRNHWHVYKKQTLLKTQWLPGVSFGNKMPQVTKSRSGTKKWSVSYYVTISRNVLSECSRSSFPSWTPNILPWFFMGKKSLLYFCGVKNEHVYDAWAYGGTISFLHVQLGLVFIGQTKCHLKLWAEPEYTLVVHMVV